MPAENFDLVPARVHEVEGQGRRAFALFHTIRYPGAIVWILPRHALGRPMPRGLPAGVAERLLLLTPKGETDLLWSVEEALRAAPVGLVIAEPEKPLSLTAGRRLQLAAEAGQTTGLMLIREGQGSNAAESRWQCTAIPTPAVDSTRLHWRLNKNKKGTTGHWTLDWDGATTALHLVSEACERHESAETSR